MMLSLINEAERRQAETKKIHSITHGHNAGTTTPHLFHMFTHL